MVLPTLAHNINAAERVDSFSVALDITENLGLYRGHFATVVGMGAY